MSLIKCKVPPGKGSWLNRFHSDIMNLQSPLVLLGKFWEKNIFSHWRQSPLRGRITSFPLPWGLRNTPHPAWYWEEILVKHWKGEGGPGRGRDVAIHPSLPPAQHTPILTLKGGGHSLLAFLGSPTLSPFFQQSSPRQALLIERYCLSAQERSMRLFPAFRSCF